MTTTNTLASNDPDLRDHLPDLNINLPTPHLNDYPMAQSWTLPTRDGDYTFYGILLGYGSSHHEVHRFHRDTTYQVKGGRACSACRWIETRIFVELASAITEADVVNTSVPSIVRYIAYTQGKTLIPDEFTKCRLFKANKPEDLVDSLVVIKTEQIFLPRASERALFMASKFSEPLKLAHDTLDLDKHFPESHATYSKTHDE